MVRYTKYNKTIPQYNNMSDKTFTASDIIKIFQTTRAKSSILRDEESGLIPRADRINRGSIKQIRAWKLADMPKIGKAYGFIHQPKGNNIISIYTPKGGVLKTTLAYNLARIFAINGIETLVIGLDHQRSITNLLANTPAQETTDINSLLPSHPSLYELTSHENPVSLANIILQTDLPTLHYIPENTKLHLLEQKIRDENKREYFLSKMIEPLKDIYKIIIFDNPPAWNFLTQNSLVAANTIIMPIGCDIGTFEAVIDHINTIQTFQKKMELSWKNLIMIPTLLEQTKLSRQIEARYRVDYQKYITTASIHRAAKGQESLLQGASIIETDPLSGLANDYRDFVGELWDKIAL
ncbi:chromosome partitioning protein [Gammaproteobacteria bacterium]